MKLDGIDQAALEEATMCAVIWDIYVYVLTFLEISGEFSI